MNDMKMILNSGKSFYYAGEYFNGKIIDRIIVAKRLTIVEGELQEDGE